MSSLHSLLKGGKIKKTRPKPSPSSSSPRKKSTTTADKASPRKAKAGSSTTAAQNPDEEDFFQDHLDDRGLVATLASDLSLRDVPQAMAHARRHMFAPVPERASGLGSARTAVVLSRRRDTPPLVTPAHVRSVLQASPAAVEREIAQLEARGALRRIRVRGRHFGEALLEARDYEALVNGTPAPALDDDDKALFLRFLGLNPRASVVMRGAVGAAKTEDALVRAGFLTARGAWGVDDADVPAGPVSTAPASVATAARAASGTVQAVGGAGGVYAVGGRGGGPGRKGRASESDLDYSLAVPGHGLYLKLVSGAVEHLVEILGKSRFGEMPESLLRERWDGGVASDEARLARRARGEWAGVLPGRTRKWKEFYGLEFAWVLEEAMGSGLVEVFETGSVGRGVRKLG